MRVFSTHLFWVVLLGGTIAAGADPAENDHRRSMGNLRPDHPTAGPAIQGSLRPRSSHRQGTGSSVYVPYSNGFGHGSHGGYGPGHSTWHGTPYVSPHGYPHGYPHRDPHFYPHVNPHAYPHGGSYGFPHMSPEAWPYGHLPYDYRFGGYWGPSYLPSESLYGPQAVKRFMGITPSYPAAPNPRIIVLGDGDDGDDDDGEPVVRRASNARSIALGRRFIEFGDAHFNAQRYAEALQRYRRATEAAPTLADARFRWGYALIALGRYEQAAEAFRRGLELDPAWPRSGFRNDDLYVENRAARLAHLDALAQAANDHPNDADFLFLVGVFLYFDDQRERAVPFFERAAHLTRPNAAHVEGFLD